MASALAAGSIELSEPVALCRASRMLIRWSLCGIAKSTLPSDAFDGLKVEDRANGAAYRTALDTLRDLGARRVAIANAPDGFNINRIAGGDPETLAATVLAHGVDVVALDGDADRRSSSMKPASSMETGSCPFRARCSRPAHWRRRRGRHGDDEWRDRAVPDSLGLTLHRTQVGDRYVWRGCRRRG